MDANRLLGKSEALGIFLLGALLLVLLFVGLACAEDQPGQLWATSGMWSHHMNEDAHHYNQNNYGMGLSYERGDFSLVGGSYLNSLYRPSTYVGIAYQPWKEGPLKVGLVGVLVSGYTRTPKYQPAVAPMASFQIGSVGANIVWVPSIVVAIQFKLKVW